MRALGGWSVVTGVTALGAGVAAGVFFAFSTFVMRGLDELPAGQSIAAMQAINRTAVTPAFMTLLFGTGALALVLGVRSLVSLDERGAWWAVVGAALYLAALVLTAAFHVPRNDALALVDPTSTGAGQDWATYVSAWTNANHVRTLLCTVAAASLGIGLITSTAG